MKIPFTRITFVLLISFWLVHLSCAVTGQALESPSITTHPAATSITGGQNATFSVTATGTNLTYQWQEKRGTGEFANISDGGVYSGATTVTLTLAKPPISMNDYQYRVQVKGYNNAVVLSNAETLTIKIPVFDNSHNWQVAGKSGFSAGVVDFTRLALDASGSPYLVYQDKGNNGKATVKKYDGSSWVNVGPPGFSAGAATSTRLAIDANGTPFVAFRDEAHGNKATVMKYDGKSWVNIGSPGFSAGEADFTSIALDAAGLPYVAYHDRTMGGKATVKRYDGGKWVDVGTPGFSGGMAIFVTLALDGNNTPFVAFTNWSTDIVKANVMKYDGSKWVHVGPAGFSPGGAYDLDFVLDRNGIPYVGFTDYANNDRASVMKYDGRQWVNIGPAGFSSGNADYSSLALDGAGTPYVSFRHWKNKATVMKFTGSSWITVGAERFSAGEVWYTSLTVDASGMAFLAYRDAGIEGKATVMKFGDVPPTAPTVTGAANCGPGEVTLTATGGTTGNYRWYTTAVGGTAVANATSATFTTPNLTATTSYYVSVVRWNSESSRAEVTATIFAKPNAPVVTPAIAYCQHASAKALTAAGNNLKWYTTATDGIPVALPPNPNTAIVGTTDYFVSQTVNDCESQRAKITVTVNALPAINSGEDQTVCVNDETFPLPGFGQVGGTWSGKGTSALGEFTPVAAGAGAHTLTYSYTQNGCTFSATKTITVMAAPTVTLAPFTDTVLHSNTTFVLTGGQPAGGTYSGNGVNKGIFNAAMAGIGTHTITYTYPANACTTTATQDIIVQESGISLATVVYPNPATDNVLVRVPLTGKNNISVKILDSIGKIVVEQYYEQVSEEFSKTFDLKGKSQGIYLLYLTTDKETITKRIALQ